jgi:hypothetical protein
VTWRKLNPYTITNGKWNITKAIGVKLPYALWDLSKAQETTYHMTAEDAKTACMELSKDAPVLQKQSPAGGHTNLGRKHE